MTEFFRHMVHASLAICLLVPIICLLRRMFRGKIDSRILYATWLVVALRLLVPLSFAAEVPSSFQWLAAEAPTTVQDMLPEPWGVQPEGAVLPPVSSISPSVIIFVLWALGAATVGAVMVVRNYRFRRALAGLPMEHETWVKCNNRLLAKGISLPPVLISPIISSPCLYGAIRPTILLPDDAIWHDWLPYALLHEACHAKSHDTRWTLLQNVLCCVFWFHPLVWLAARLSRADAEMACDARVLACIDTPERFSYARALVNIASQKNQAQPAFAPGISFAGERLVERVRHIVENPAGKKAATVLTACVLCVLLAFSFVSAETADAPTARAAQAATLYEATASGYFTKSSLDGSFTPKHIIYGWAWVEAGGKSGYVKLDDLDFVQGAYQGAEATVCLTPGSPTRDRLNLRKAPAVESEVIDSYFYGVKVEVLEFGKTWCHIQAGEETGYMMTRFLAFDIDLENGNPVIPPTEAQI